VKPVLFVTGHAPGYRVGAFARLHEREDVEFALFGGRSTHAGAAFDGELPFPHRYVSQRGVAALAASGRYRAVVFSTGGRIAPAAAWLGARRAGVPLILWASLWAHPRGLAHTFGYLPLLGLYRSADAVVTYGSHVSDYVRARGARNVHIAPQSVDNRFWSASAIAAPDVAGWPSAAKLTIMFSGRPAPGKGVDVLLAAWEQAQLAAPAAALVLVGVGGAGRSALTHGARGPDPAGVLRLAPVGPIEMRNLYAACDVLVVPSIPTRTFREPWGLVVNEAMNRGVPVIATDAVGAAAGGLVLDGETGLVVRAGNSAALAGAIRRLAADPALRERLGSAGARAVRAFSHDAWAQGFSAALSSLGVSRTHW
jgi:glycosyltransferase involved in cell wall biosynthesis